MTIYAKTMRKWSETIELIKNSMNENSQKKMKGIRGKKEKATSKNRCCEDKSHKECENNEIDQMLELEKMKKLARLEEERINKMQEEIRKKELAIMEQIRLQKIRKDADNQKNKMIKNKEMLENNNTQAFDSIKRPAKKGETKTKTLIKPKIRGKKKIKYNEMCYLEDKNASMPARNIITNTECTKDVNGSVMIEEEDNQMNDARKKSTPKPANFYSGKSSKDPSNELKANNKAKTTKKCLAVNKKRKNAVMFTKRRKCRRQAEPINVNNSTINKKLVENTKNDNLIELKNVQNCNVGKNEANTMSVNKQNNSPIADNITTKSYENRENIELLTSVCNNNTQREKNNQCSNDITGDVCLDFSDKNNQRPENCSDKLSSFNSYNVKSVAHDTVDNHFLNASNHGAVKKLQDEISERLKQKKNEDSRSVLRPKNRNVCAKRHVAADNKKIVLPDVNHNQENIDPNINRMKFEEKLMENTQIVNKLMTMSPKKNVTIKRLSAIKISKNKSTSNSLSASDLKDENNSYVRKLIEYRNKHFQTRRQLRRQEILAQKNRKLNQAFEKIKNLFLEKKIRESIIANSSMDTQLMDDKHHSAVDDACGEKLPAFETPISISQTFSKKSDIVYKQVIDNKISTSEVISPHKSYDPCRFVPKTNLPLFNVKNEDMFKQSFKKKEWVLDNNIIEIVKAQNHFEIEKYFETPLVDICKMFPNTPNLSNDSPNKLISSSK